MPKRKNKVLEITKGKSKKEQEKFFVEFSERQLNAILLVVLISTFLIQGAIKYLEFLGKEIIIKQWFSLILIAILFLLSSVITISLSGIMSQLKIKRYINMISFVTFLTGFSIFIYSIVILIKA